MKYLVRLMFVGLALSVLEARSTAPQTAERELVSKRIIKSPNDKREYLHLELGNGLQVVLISDLEADKSAASLTVFCGSFHDPEGRPGLAHFLEHMLFIGTEKYPEPDGYFNFVQSHGGNANAYTDSEHTNYFFDIQPGAFREGMDRFAQFFISPLFQEKYVAREKNAVDAEYKLQIKEDGWRAFAVQKAASNPEHPISRFNIGTLETLGGDVHEALLTFFRNNYSANRMGLVVLTNETLADMQPWILDIFSHIENRNLPPIERMAGIFAEGQLPATLRHDNIKDYYQVSYTFPLPSTGSFYRQKPVGYLANLLGHEGDGSLHSLFNSKGWINSLAASEDMIDDHNSVMEITIGLTEEGAAHVPRISAYLFAYLDMLQNREMERWLYDEQATVARLGFRFAEKSRAINLVRAMSPGMQRYPAKDLLIAPYLMEEFDTDLIRGFLQALNKDNVLVTLSSPGYEGGATEKWFGVSYDLTPGPVQMADVDTNALTLPSPNPFLPDSLALAQGDEEGPRIVIGAAGVEIYQDTDLEFGVPRAVTHVSLRNPNGLVARADAARAKLYIRLVQDDLNALAYPALLAGMNYQIAAHPKGFRLSVTGYHDKQLLLLEEVLKRLVGLEIDPQRFTLLKMELLKDLENTSKDRPFIQSYRRLRNEMRTADWAPAELIEALADVTRSDLVIWRNRMLQAVTLQAMLHGNVTDARADELLSLIKQYVRVKVVSTGDPQVVAVNDARVIGLDIDHADASMALYVQDESDSYEDLAKSALLTHLIAPGFFSSLRIEQQLGYVVTAVNMILRRRGGISFVIQSPVAGPDELRQRTLDFMDEQTGRLAGMSAEEFSTNKSGLIARLTQKDKSLAERSYRYWSDLDLGVTTFDSNMRVAAEVAKLSIGDISQFLNLVRRKLDNRYVMVFSEGRFGETKNQVEAGAGVNTGRYHRQH